MILPIRGVRRLGGKPAKTGGDVDAAAKERPEEAPFAALRPHDYRLRTCSRAPAAKPTRPKGNNDNKEILKKNDSLITFSPRDIYFYPEKSGKSIRPESRTRRAAYR